MEVGSDGACDHACCLRTVTFVINNSWTLLGEKCQVLATRGAKEAKGVAHFSRVWNAGIAGERRMDGPIGSGGSYEAIFCFYSSIYECVNGTATILPAASLYLSASIFRVPCPAYLDDLSDSFRPRFATLLAPCLPASWPRPHTSPRSHVPHG